MSSRRPPEWDEDEWDDRPRRRSRPAPAPARRFGIAAVAAALVGGLFVGYVANSGGGGTTTITQSRTVTAPLESTAAAGAVSPSPASARATISLAVLNGSDESGLAATGADDARSLGYQRVTEGNAPAPVSADLVLHREGAAPQAARVAQDLELPAPELATAGDPVLGVAPDADVVVVLGPTGGSGVTADEPAADDGVIDPTETAPAG